MIITCSRQTPGSCETGVFSGECGDLIAVPWKTSAALGVREGHDGDGRNAAPNGMSKNHVNDGRKNDLSTGARFFSIKSSNVDSWSCFFDMIILFEHFLTFIWARVFFVNLVTFCLIPCQPPM